VLQGVLPTLVFVHGDDIESVLVILSPETETPYRRYFRDDRLLPPVDRFHWASPHHRPSGLNLDKNHGIAPAGDQVNVVAAELEAVSLDVPATGYQVGNGGAFSPESPDLPEVFPLRCRDEAADAGHGRAYMDLPELRHRAIADGGMKLQTQRLKVLLMVEVPVRSIT
jgi:hypothetical protein